VVSGRFAPLMNKVFVKKKKKKIMIKTLESCNSLKK